MKLVAGNADSDAWSADKMAARAVAEHPDEANVQHCKAPAASQREYANISSAKQPRRPVRKG
jgi:hypothetical protein